MRALFGMPLGIAGLLLTSVLTGAGPAGATTTTSQVTADGAVVAGTGTAAPARSVTVGAANARARSMARATATRDAVPAAPLGRDGRPAGGALKPPAHTGTRRQPHAAAAGAAGTPNHGRAAHPGVLSAAHPGVLPATRPAAGRATARHSAAAVASSMSSQPSGLTEGGTDCTNCQTPDATAAMSGSEVVETANLAMQVDNASGAVQCTMSLPGLVGAVSGLSRPRVQFDNAGNRFSLVIDSVPGSSGDVPIQYLATSQTSDACGAWWIYSIVFTGGSTPSLYPFGALLDYPYLGQDGVSLLSSTNNYSFGGSYLGSAGYAMPKAAAYSGAGFSFTTYQVAFSTAPVTVAGIPTFATTKTYWVAAVPGSGYDLYAMPTSPAGPITLQAAVSASFSAPASRVTQPGTSQTLDPLDGRIQSAAVQDGSFVWFTNDVNDQGLPTVRYGAINVTNNRATVALAYHSPGSDDFNPSIGVSDAGGGTNYIWVNWAYTNAANGVPVTDTVLGVGPGQGVPNAVGADLPLARGSSTSTISTFGGYSSVAIDPAPLASNCPAGLTALTAQEFFTSSGTWTTELAETTFC